MGFSEALKKLEAAVGDLSSLEVLTFTGEISSALKDKEGGGGKEIAWDQLFDKSMANAGTLKLVAATRVKFDGDTRNFQTSEKLERLNEMLQVHEQSVNNSRLARQSLVQFFADNLKGIVGK